ETPDATPPAAIIYRRAQALPYRLALLTICVWFVISAVGLLVARFHLGFDFDDTIILSTATLVLAVAGAIYEQLWHRDVLRPLLAHLTQRYRVPVRSIAPSLSLRSKLMLSFGGVVLLACGMALLWGFVQYKNLATDAALRQSDIGLSWLRSEVQTELGNAATPPNTTSARSPCSTRAIAAAASRWCARCASYSCSSSCCSARARASSRSPSRSSWRRSAASNNAPTRWHVASSPIRSPRAARATRSAD